MPPNQRQCVLGIDPATNCGFAAKSPSGEWLLYEAVHLGAGDRRLLTLRDMLLARVDQLGITQIATEASSFGGNPANKEFHGTLLGIIKLVTCERNLLPVMMYQPSRIKKFATNHGHADKLQMIKAVRMNFNLTVDNDNVADAMFICDMAWRNYPTSDQKKKAAKAVERKRKSDPRLFR